MAMNEWMKEHNYAFQNADTRPRLQSRTQNICFFISISAVISGAPDEKIVQNHLNVALLNVF